MDKKVAEKVEKFIDEHELNAYRSSEQWILPYKDKDGNRLYLYIRLSAEQNVGLKMGFKATIYDSNLKFVEKLKTILLDLNTRLKMGALALEKDSEVVEFSLDYPLLGDADIDWNQSNKYVIFCMNVYLDLINRDLVRESVLDE